MKISQHSVLKTLLQREFERMIHQYPTHFRIHQYNESVLIYIGIYTPPRHEYIDIHMTKWLDGTLAQKSLNTLF